MRPARLNFIAPLALAASIAISGCGTVEQSTTYFPLSSRTSDKSALDVPAAKFTADLMTPAGFKIKTNGQYKTDEQKRAASAAIDRYWSEVSKCAIDALEAAGDTNAAQRIAEFPSHLSIEIANTWTVVEGPTTHRRMQAFPSLARPGTWATARREGDELYIQVVPELNGLAPQMNGELTLWLSTQMTIPNDLTSKCASVPCIRFAYSNTPSQAWNECIN